MQSSQTINTYSKMTLGRLHKRLSEHFPTYVKKHPENWKVFISRLDAHFPRLFKLLYELYGTHYDFFYHLEELTFLMARYWINRPEELKGLDISRIKNPDWFKSNKMLGGVCYVDLFSENLNHLKEKIPYFKELGLTYLHLMPLFKCPELENDGGYAVSDYRTVNPVLGNMEELKSLADDLRKEGVSLVLDFVFNHTSDEHTWAEKAKNGDEIYQNYYRIFPDRREPDAYDAHLREIFPDARPGSFTYYPDLNKWVWTTFNSFQWDLNYSNPEVFNAMACEMLFLANIGVEVLRLDAVAFIWKKLGTSCENLPEAHKIIQAFNAVVQISAPAMLFKSEAIVHPDEVIQYINPEECQLSYNPLLMALLWNSLATRDVRLLDLALRERHLIPDGCGWVNYVRCHDDIGWTFSDEDAGRLGINGYNHRKFLNSFYTGRFPGSFSRGLPFQENLKTGDARISGSCASLAGLEKALKEETSKEVDLAIKRIKLIHGIILTIGGIPLIYLGDEIGSLNDYSFRDNPNKASDSRWIHRPPTDWDKIALRNNSDTIEGKIFSGLTKLIHIRQEQPAFSIGEMQVINTENDHVLGYVRRKANERILIFANFTEEKQTISGNLLRIYGLSYEFLSLTTGKKFSNNDILLKPYELIILKCK